MNSLANNRYNGEPIGSPFSNQYITDLIPKLFVSIVKVNLSFGIHHRSSSEGSATNLFRTTISYISEYPS